MTKKDKKTEEKDSEDNDDGEKNQSSNNENKENPSRKIQIHTLNTNIEIISSDPEDKLETIKKMVESLLDKYERS